MIVQNRNFIVRMDYVRKTITIAAHVVLSTIGIAGLFFILTTIKGDGESIKSLIWRRTLGLWFLGLRFLTSDGLINHSYF